MLNKIIKYLIIFTLIITIIFFITNYLVISTTKDKIIKESDVYTLEDIDCIIVLGAGIRNETPTPMLEDRLLQGMTLYNNTKTKILVSGDHMNKGYDEVNVMKNYLINKNIPSEDVFMDHAGISTYDSIYRAKYIFNAKKIIIVTQEYHMYRSLYIAEKLDIEAYGVTSNPRKYRNQKIRDIREFLARTKDFFKVTFKLKSTYLGEKIPLNKSGDITND